MIGFARSCQPVPYIFFLSFAAVAALVAGCNGTASFVPTHAAITTSSHGTIPENDIAIGRLRFAEGENCQAAC